MSEDNLPAPGPADDGQRLPATRGHGGAMAHPGQGTLALDIYREERRQDDDEIDLLAYWRILLKRRWLVLGVLAGTLALALLATLLMPSIYRGTTILQIDREVMQVVQVEGVTPTEGGPSPDFYQTQYELLKSRALAERVADELNLAGRVDSLSPPSWWEQVTALMRPAPAGEEDDATEADRSEELRAAAQFVQEHTEIEPVRNSQLVRIHFDSQIPTLSARVSNALAEGFIASAIERRFGASSYARNYLEDQLAEMKGRLEQSERALVEFAQQEGLVNTGDGQSLSGQNLTELNAQLAAVQAQRIAAQSRAAQATAGRGAALPADMLANSIIRTLQQQRAQLQAEYQEQLQVFKPEYPAMQQLQGQIEALDKSIAEELAGIRASVQAEYAAAQAQENMLIAKIDELRNATLNVDQRSIRYNILKREVDTNRELYDGLLQRFKEIGVAGGVTANNIAVVDRAQVPQSRYKPNLALNLALGLVLGLMLGVLLALVLEFLDDTLKTPDDIEQRLRLPLLGIIPKLGKETPSEAFVDPRSAFAEAYRSVRTALQFSTDQGVPRVLLVTSPVPSEGKSTTALTLARNFAQLGKRVLLIEADLRNPSLHRVLGMRGEHGLSSLLAGSSSPSDVILDSADERLKIILAGPLPPNPAELLSGSRLVSLLAVASEKFDQVIIDGPPVLGIADAPILSNAANGTLLVVQAGKTKISTAQTALKRLLAARARVIGALLTQYDAKATGYGYEYESYYAYGASNTPRLGRG